MKTLVILHPQYGHKELTVEKDIKTEFEKIMKDGYSSKIPAVFQAEKKDGTHHRAVGENAEKFLHDPEVETVTIYPMLAGG